MLGGCGDNRDPCLELVAGERLKVTIIGRFYGSTSPVECDTTLGLEDGQELDLTITGYVASDQNCKSASAEFEPHAGWAWAYRAPGNLNADIMGFYRASNGLCAGNLQIGLSSTSLPSASWQPGPSNYEPPAHLDTLYGGDQDGDPSCPLSCSPDFGVDVRSQ
jgi:hypothetical protein